MEKWNPHSKIRQDLFGFADLLAYTDGRIALIQTTSRSNLAARRRKILESDAAMHWVTYAGGDIFLHGWYQASKTKGGPAIFWTLKEEVITPDDFKKAKAKEGLGESDQSNCP